jgi:hypothetical protein
VATNISLIADAKIAELKIDPHRGVLRKWTVTFFVVAAVLVCLIFVGTYLSKERYLGVVRAQADEVLKANSSLLEETSRLLASAKPEDYKRIIEIRKFLQSQRSDLPELTVIYSGKFAGKLAFYRIEDFGWDQQNNIYASAYYKCTQNLDCDYLARFFSGEKADVLQKYTIRNDQFYIYIPFPGADARFVLLFARQNSYGKIGFVIRWALPPGGSQITRSSLPHPLRKRKYRINIHRNIRCGPQRCLQLLGHHVVFLEPVFGARAVSCGLNFK